MKKNIIFDIGYVLVTWNPDLVYGAYFSDDKKMKLFYEETAIFQLNAEMDKGLSFADGVKKLSQQFPHYHEPIQFWQTRWKEMIGGIVHESVEILKQLHQLKHPLFGLTNWSEETFPYVLNKYDFFQCFRDIVVSGKEKVIKPHPEIYEILLARNNLDPKHCLFIDDNVDNVMGAQKVGIEAIKFENPAQLASDLRSFGINVKP